MDDADDVPPIRSRTSSRRRPRIVLALLDAVPPSSPPTTFSSDATDDAETSSPSSSTTRYSCLVYDAPYDLRRVQRNASNLRLGGGTGRRKRRERLKRKEEGDVESAGVAAGSGVTCEMDESDGDGEEEFTLFYFADATCLNSLRFLPLLARFVDAANHEFIVGEDDYRSDDGGGLCDGAGNSAPRHRRFHRRVRVICVPNDEDGDRIDGANDGDEIVSSNGDDRTAPQIKSSVLAGGTGFAFLPLRHPNRSALIRLLSVSAVPTLVVVSNRTGRVVTDRGMAAIERHMGAGTEEEDGSSSSPLLAASASSVLLASWRDGKSGAPFLSSSCAVS